MSHEASSDIRLRLLARKNGNQTPSETINKEDPNKENQKPQGVLPTETAPRGRGRGIIMRERLERRRQNGKLF